MAGQLKVGWTTGIPECTKRFKTKQEAQQYINNYTYGCHNQPTNATWYKVPEGTFIPCGYLERATDPRCHACYRQSGESDALAKFVERTMGLGDAAAKPT